MQTLLTILLAAAMLGTLGVLIAGMVGMARGQSGARSQKLMRYRVIMQGIALVIFALLMLSMR